MSEIVMPGHNIKVLPYDICPNELTIVKCINDHARTRVVAIVPEEEKDKYVNMTKTHTTMEIKYEDESGVTQMFKGVVTDIEVKVVRGIFYVTIDGISNTFNLDLKIKRRSFQDKNMTYTSLIKEVIKDYSGADYIDVAAKSKKIEKFIIQYDETDWQFLKRMASHFNAGLIADTNSDKPKFWFGVPQGGQKGNIEQYNYSVSKRIGDFRVSSENYIEGIDEKDFTYFKVETNAIFNIGDSVSFLDKSLYVFQLIARLQDGILVHEYLLTQEKGMSQNLIQNEKVQGASVEGKVIEIKEDNLRVHLEIDEKQEKEKAYWFPYSTFYTTEGQTGWYCMPELDDYVKLYFPTNREEEGVITNSIRRKTVGGDFITDPDVKYFRTKFGKELMFNKDEIMITGKDEEILIRLVAEEGIEIYSNKDIKIKADKGLFIESGKNLNITAGSKINVVCKDSQIEMNGITTIKGSKVKTN
ncbi:MAG: Phage late control gene D protein (GPD) [Firmicutes bacterium ADurb.Bin419]|nr:MAG: Phage late control gene D protein (GPD) [Firmicutes bacterium ADurb.Bin419]